MRMRLVLAVTAAVACLVVAPAASAEQPASRNMRLIAHNDLGGGERGKGGEGFSEVRARDGRRILYVAHESAPVCFSILDVTRRRDPRLLDQVPTPNADTRCNNLDASGDLLVVPNQVATPGLKPAGVQIYDIRDPRRPRPVGYFDTSGPFSRGAHHVWFTDGRFMHVSTGLPDLQPRRVGLDDQHYAIVDLKDPSRPREVGRWWYPGTREGDPEPSPTPNLIDDGCRLHDVEVFPSRPDRAYLAYIDCGIVILDIADKARPRVVARWDDSPPETGYAHTVMPLRGGRFLAVAHEVGYDRCADFPKLLTFVDARARTRLSYAPLPLDVVELCQAGGRSGPHQIHENDPDELSFQSEDVVVGAFFNGGVRVYDVRNLARPREVAYHVPPAPPGSPAGTIQINDVYVDDRGAIFAVDRMTGGLYVLESPAVDRARE